MAHRRKYLATVQFRVYRNLTIRCWSLNVEGSSFLLSHPTPSEAAKPPKPIPFRVQTHSMAFFFLSKPFLRQASRLGRAGQKGQSSAENRRARGGFG